MANVSPDNSRKTSFSFADKSWIALWGVIGTAVVSGILLAITATLVATTVLFFRPDDSPRIPIFILKVCLNHWYLPLWLLPIAGGFFFALDTRDSLTFTRFGMPDYLQRQACDQAVRQYFATHSQEYLRPEHWKLISKDPGRHLSLVWGQSVGYDFSGGPDPSSEYFVAHFWIRDVDFSERLVCLLSEKLKTPQSKCRVYASRWYPDGDLLVSAERSVLVQHQSTLRLAEVRSYFEPSNFEKWMARGSAFIETEGDTIWLSVMQDHTFALRLLDNSPQRIVYDQLLERNRCNVIINLHENEAGTLVSVTFHGVISTRLEGEYKSDWTVELIP